MNSDLAFVIENNSDLAELFAETARMEGFRTEIIQDDQAAMERLPREQPHLVLLDLHLANNGSGAEILRYIRSDAALAATIVFVITGDSASADDQREQGRADLVIVKPIRLADLRILIRRTAGQAKNQ
jgi:CheY-like chemotaxis protein